MAAEISEEELRDCHAHAKAINGELIEVYINPDGCYADPEREKAIRKLLAQWAKELVEIGGINHPPVHYVIPRWGEKNG